ncbi:MAG: hypothetical protein Q8N13_10555 [Acidovorax sp.]|nr:hypothetical protein [Acidovorax sp.]
MQIATLTIEMAANVARLRQDMDNAASMVQGATAKMQKAAELAGKALGLIGVGLSVSAFTGFVRNAIDAADALDEMSGRVGVSAKELSGLQLAYKQAGMGNDAMASSLAKLSREMSEGNAGLRALGVNTRNADGSLRGTTEVLLDVANKFTTLEDGAAKTALAIEIFGKSGTDMVPLLNSGSEGIAQMTAMAERLGLVIEDSTAAQAGQFNDTLELLGLGVEGVGSRIAAQLLPTLTSLTGSFLETMSSGERLAGIADFLASSLKLLYTVGLSIVEVFSTVGKTLGAAMGQVLAILKGDFAQASAIGQEWQRDVTAGWASTSAAVQAAWSAESNAAVVSAATTMKVNQDLLTAQKAREEGAKKSAAAATKAADEFAKLRDKINGRDSGTDPDFLKNLQILQKGSKSLEEYLRLAEKYIASQKYMQDADKAALQVAQLKADARNQEANAIAAQMAAQEQAAAQQLASVRDRVTSLQLEERALAMSRDRNITLAEAIEQVALARLRERQEKLAVGTEAYDAIEREIEARRELIGLVQNQGVREAAEAATAESLKMADQINNSLTDALMRGFESGKDFARNMLDTVVNMFKTTVLRPIISAIINPIAGGITSAIGGGVAGAVGQASGASGLLSLGSMASSITGIGQYMATGFLNTVAGTGTAAGVTAGGAIGGANGFAMQLGAVAPWLLGAVALASLWKPLFGRTLKDSGVQGEFGGERGFEGESYKYYKGGLFRSDKTETSALQEEIRKALGDTFLAMKAQVTDFAEALGLSTDRLAGYTSAIKISTFGLDDQKAQAVFQEALATANNDLAQQVLGTWETTTERVQRTISGMTGGHAEGGDWYSETYDEDVTTSTYTPSEFAKEGEKAIDTLTRLATSITVVNSVFDVLGYTMYEKSLAGADAASKMIDAFGGAEQFMAATGSYYQNFYSDAERFANAQRKLSEGFAELGVSMPLSKDELRKLIEAQDLSTDAGRKMYASLITLSGGFNEVAMAVEGYNQNYYTESERFANAQRKLAEGFGELGIAMPRSRSELRRLIEAQDLNTEAGREMYASLISLSGGFYEVAMAIENVFANISKTTAQSVRDIQMSIMSNEEKYSFLDKEIDGVIARMSSATSPEEIERLFQQANSATTAAYNLLSPEEQVRLNAEFVDRLYELEAVAQSRLDVAGQTADSAEQQVQAAADAKEAAQSQREAAAEMTQAAADMLRAAQETLKAAMTPKVIDLRFNGQAANEVTYT